MIRRPPRSTQSRSSAASDVYKRQAVDGPRGIFADAMSVPTGGRMIQRTPNDPAWYKGGLYHDDMPLNVPGLWFMSWYDVSVGPNLALYNHVRTAAKGAVADEQWAVSYTHLRAHETRHE